MSVRVRVSADSLEQRLLECVRIEMGLLSHMTINTATSTATPLLLLYHYSLLAPLIGLFFCSQFRQTAVVSTGYVR